MSQSHVYMAAMDNGASYSRATSLKASSKDAIAVLRRCNGSPMRVAQLRMLILSCLGRSPFYLFNADTGEAYLTKEEIVQNVGMRSNSAVLLAHAIGEDEKRRRERRVRAACLDADDDIERRSLLAGAKYKSGLEYISARLHTIFAGQDVIQTLRKYILSHIPDLDSRVLVRSDGELRTTPHEIELAYIHFCLSWTQQLRRAMGLN